MHCADIAFKKNWIENILRVRILPPEMMTPSSLMASELIIVFWPLKFCMNSPFGNFHNLMLSVEPDANIFSVGCKANERTLFFKSKLILEFILFIYLVIRERADTFPAGQIPQFDGGIVAACYDLRIWTLADHRSHCVFMATETEYLRLGSHIPDLNLNINIFYLIYLNEPWQWSRGRRWQECPKLGAMPNPERHSNGRGNVEQLCSAPNPSILPFYEL